MRTVSQLPPPEQVSARLLQKLGKVEPPVDLRRVVAIWNNLAVVDEELDGSGYLLPLGRLGAEIVVNRSDPVERRRFTIAHELGHWVLGLIWRKKTGEFRQPAGLHREAIERWCDVFAANTLMPRLSIEACFSGSDDLCLTEKVMTAARVFQVSDEALFLRLWEVLRVQVALLNRQNSRHGKVEFVVERSYADDRASRILKDLLTSADAVTKMEDPVFLFTARVGATTLRCSGRSVAGPPDRKVIMTVRHSRAR